MPGWKSMEQFEVYWTSDIGLPEHIEMCFPIGIGGFRPFFPVRNVKYRGPSPYRREFCSIHPDYQFIQTQLDIWEEIHVQECKQSMTGKHTLRVIDCKSRQLTTVKPGEPYICLSYMWGSGTTQDVRELGNELPAGVPKAVEDAMAIAINLGIPYLWVDRYCIDQGNPQEKHRLVKNMNRIYEQAEVTIIAAIGDDPHHGLAGV
ncbi:hypothetical protein COCSADRAFT_31620 [Bipolaris sorokiniana ND90Pr]|uniref:Heterokaryon incompatibility domain-containing protein n=1 Tax=Cochliobolus sativus (strain ND90Pr / ATCC 201652) TaxID=665912 RepID=M2QT06_COCSN|nr:uncharacterized protein COCSADRAFT_31620 [Bipolaris sorokiniana ND90Pr]EMD58309.1 hypothetical protein COCSADRAFT_31620 [Bipolaris sorokiniana ND90Pr]